MKRVFLQRKPHNHIVKELHCIVTEFNNTRYKTTCSKFFTDIDRSWSIAQDTCITNKS